ncbi:hypothetical protein TrRE_jg7244 [Triparma retinervis]|uniref:Uncharacterized protein n=1 Tax=Triparma retinervis TaxID=2557542 RepID=A0A9W7E2F5_9STRA|nr:hypothetical protein TrRE_jg7244 [Triparma retinervis]
MAVGDVKLASLSNLDLHLATLISLLLFLVFCIYIGKTLSDNNKANRSAREQRDYRARVEGSTYRCIRPQVLGSMVVFPVSVARRDAEVDGVVKVTDERPVGL